MFFICPWVILFLPAAKEQMIICGRATNATRSQFKLICGVRILIISASSGHAVLDILTWGFFNERTGRLDQEPPGRLVGTEKLA